MCVSSAEPRSECVLVVCSGTLEFPRASAFLGQRAQSVFVFKPSNPPGRVFIRSQTNCVIDDLMNVTVCKTNAAVGVKKEEQKRRKIIYLMWSDKLMLCRSGSRYRLGWLHMLNLPFRGVLSLFVRAHAGASR